jgi:AraC family transcriptional regulator
MPVDEEEQSPSVADLTGHGQKCAPAFGARVTPDQWAARLSGPAHLSSSRTVWPTAQLRHWRGTAAVMEQPALDHHYIVQHLGGGKRVKRHFDGESICEVVDSGSLTIVPAGSYFKWVTQGPIEFAHLYLSPALLAHAASRLDRGSAVTLIDRVGCRDPLLEALYHAMLVENRSPLHAEPLYLDSLLETFLLRLLRDHSTMARVEIPGREMLPKHRLRRVQEFIEARLECSITLADLAEIAGGSVYHFSRAFKNTVGDSPYQYVLRCRTERAKVFLNTTDLPLAEIATACGFRNTLHLSKTFARIIGIAPTRFRRQE